MEDVCGEVTLGVEGTVAKGISPTSLLGNYPSLSILSPFSRSPLNFCTSASCGSSGASDRCREAAAQPQPSLYDAPCCKRESSRLSAPAGSPNGRVGVSFGSTVNTSASEWCTCVDG